MRLEVQHIEHPNRDERRIDTGPVKFGDDWCGVFIRGDNSLVLRGMLHDYRKLVVAEPESAFKPLGLQMIDRWIALMDACQE
jgi:hypothetical protein